jgi:hypothetical protein
VIRGQIDWLDARVLERSSQSAGGRENIDGSTIWMEGPREGTYSVARSAGTDRPVAVRITDMLGEEVLVVEDQSA